MHDPFEYLEITKSLSTHMRFFQPFNTMAFVGLSFLFQLLLLQSVFPSNESLRILSLVHTPVMSHHIFNRVLNLELATRGHHVTVVSAHEEKFPPKGADYRHFVVNADIKVDNKFSFENIADKSAYANYCLMFQWVDEYCESLVKSASLRRVYEAIRNETFDLVLYELALKECTLGFVQLFNNPPTVAISPIGFTPWISSISGNPEIPSYMPFYLMKMRPPFSLWEKLINQLLDRYNDVYYNWVHLSKMERYGRELFGASMPRLSAVVGNTSLFLVNSNWAQDTARPLSPDVIPVGGMHIQKPKPLSQNLTKWMQESEHGVILFSLGSILGFDHLPKGHLEVFKKAFGQLKERVLWKFDRKVDNLTENVKIARWIPQGDVLAHKKVLLFISHCGGMSMNEAIHNGRPVIAIPFFLDQMSNAYKLTQRGMAITLQLNNLTAEILVKVIRTVIDDPSYQERAWEMQHIYHDQPMLPLKRAVYWVEYVAKHRGAKHLRLPSRDMAWHELTILDAQLVGLLVCLLLATLAHFCLRRIYSRLCLKRKLKLS